ncbi:membrane protein [Streptococcus porcinus]|uniref:Membrane protein n=1 Tax=Streptococcus porcinus TaxID=1340 RepID=A0A4V0HA20_STRPO|nr:membrane protein [Streptococcus porcinus]VTT46633.1 membrane protein [Streptococcus porcinus]
MKLYKLTYYITKFIITLSISYLLLTHYNEISHSEISSLVAFQLINPFLSINGQQLSFLKLIMILGLSFTSFLTTYAFMAELSIGVKTMIRAHCNNHLKFQISIYRVITSLYLKEFILQVICIYSISSILLQDIEQVINLTFLLLTWFFVDSICYFFITYYISNNVLVLIAICIEILIRFILFKQIAILLFVVLLHLLLNAYWRYQFARN